MNRRNGERGTSTLILVFLLLIVVSSLIRICLWRSQAGFATVKNRYWTGVVRDMAENGIAYERLMIGKGKMAEKANPHRLEVGTFAGLAGIFESHGRALENDFYEIVSLGELLNRDGMTKFSLRVTAKAHLRSDGSWKTVSWSEQPETPKEMSDETDKKDRQPVLEPGHDPRSG